ncbi:hypothetical protein BC834DRAFT_426113 [Gloeopeniophorella convolvens]|nr:hypothetical protein BC834DRAFT_426113 [Gloeopeniophorella convolvens]
MDYWPFHLVVHAKETRDDYQYTPTSDFHLRIDGLPRCILEVNSTGRVACPDRYWMLLQAACLARLANSLRKPGTNKPVVIMAIYVDVRFVATQNLLCQPDPLSNEVRYLSREFDLRTREGAFEFMFRLYNLKSQLVLGINGLDPDLYQRIQDVKNEVFNRQLNFFISTTKPPSKWKCGDSSGAHDPAQPGPSHDAQTRRYILDEPAILKILKASGYTLTNEEIDGLIRLTPVKPSMREATAADGSKVVIKPLDSKSDELKILRYLNAIKSPRNHTIELADAFEHPVGRAIVLPWCTPLRELLDF